MRAQMLNAFWCVTLIAGSYHQAAVCAADESPAAVDKSPTAATSAGLPADWKKDIEVPEVQSPAGVLPGSKLKLWVQQGWLVARYETLDRGLEWQVILAQANDAKEPEIRFDKPSSFELKYGQYFIREYVGHLRLFRERKTDNSPPWPEIPIDDGAHGLGSMRSAGGYGMTHWEIGDWRWLGCGLIDQQHAIPRSDVWMRVYHKHELPRDPTVPQSNAMMGFITFAVSRLGQYTAHDEGDMFIAERSLASEAQVRERLAQALNGRPAPDLPAARWYNEAQLPAGTVLSPQQTRNEANIQIQAQSLRGNVVLLYFWMGDTYDPWAATLKERFKDRGLVAIAIHSARNVVGPRTSLQVSDLDTVINDRHIDLPVGIDARSEECERAYNVKVWPTYFLIDKEGKVRQGFLEHPPTDKHVEELLK